MTKGLVKENGGLAGVVADGEGEGVGVEFVWDIFQSLFFVIVALFFFRFQNIRIPYCDCQRHRAKDDYFNGALVCLVRSTRTERQCDHEEEN